MAEMTYTAVSLSVLSLTASKVKNITPTIYPKAPMANAAAGAASVFFLFEAHNIAWPSFIAATFR